MSTRNTPRNSFTQQRNSAGAGQFAAGDQNVPQASRIASNQWRRHDKFHAILRRGHRQPFNLPSWSQGHFEVYAPLDANKKNALRKQIYDLVYTQNMQAYKSVTVECTVLSRTLLADPADPTRTASSVTIMSWTNVHIVGWT